jgi:phosphatidylserine synthase
VSHFVDVWRIYTLMMGRRIMLRHEWIAVLFFAHIAVAALVRRRMPARRRTAAGIGAVIAAAGVLAIAHIASMAVRAWAPILFILAGYYLSGRTFFAPNPRIEPAARRWRGRARRWSATAQARPTRTAR